MNNTKQKLINGGKFLREFVVKNQTLDSKQAISYLGVYLDLVDEYVAKEDSSTDSYELAKQIFTNEK